MSVAISDLPTLYQYYISDGIATGLSDKQSYFTLNNKNITIYSGALHYFRVPRAYWSDRLRKIRAAGLNAVETYVPWNLHEPQSGVYDFGDSGSDFEDFLHLQDFLKEARNQDLFAIVRPGPYICAEWEFGGLPSWILRNTSSVRNSVDKNFLFYAKRFLNVLLPLLAVLQFQKGGPIIGFQIENEYSNTFNYDRKYLLELKQTFLENGIEELLFTSDPPLLGLSRGAIPGVLQTANFNFLPTVELSVLKLLQPKKPVMVMEYWSGWYDYWLGNHNPGSTEQDFRSRLKEILDFPSSVNFYMFVGSTNFGFMNGANTLLPYPFNIALLPITTSYDYGAPITEYGNYTTKYYTVKELIALYNKILTKIPDQPKEIASTKYSRLIPVGQLLLSEIIDNYDNKIKSENVLPMEYLPINNNSGQSYGYIVYRKSNVTLRAGAILKISGSIRDTVLVLVNGKLVSPVPKSKFDIFGFGFWKSIISFLKLTSQKLQNATIDIIVENFGRNGFGILSMFKQFKGLTDNVYIDGIKIKNWEIVPLEFKKSWTNSLSKWHDLTTTNVTPALYKFVLNISGPPQDTFVDLRNWTKGITIINGFVLGRHFFLGPQQSLYLPAPFLKQGENIIVVFEHYNAPSVLNFSYQPIFGSLS